MTNMLKQNNVDGRQVTPRTPLLFDGLIDNVFKSTLHSLFDQEGWKPKGNTTRQAVPVNIRELEKEYLLEVIAPGLKKEDFRVHMSDNTLTISFEQQREREEGSGSRYLRLEFRQQSFSRSFNLDDSIDAERISAQYKDGVLQLSLPKREDAQRITKNIEVQ